MPFRPDDRDDAATLTAALELATALSPLSPEAAAAATLARELLAACDSRGQLPKQRRGQARLLVGLLESRLA